MSAVPSHASAASCFTAARVYRRRHPERSALYRLAQQHLETWLARQRDAGGTPIPRYVERELRGCLECGILACGHDFLLAFSCKGRGLCPSRTTRRMAEAAAHLVGDVFPQVPVRQWVVALPRDCATSCTATRRCSARCDAACCAPSSPGCDVLSLSV